MAILRADRGCSAPPRSVRWRPALDAPPHQAAAARTSSIDANTVRRIVRTAGVGPDDVVRRGRARAWARSPWRCWSVAAASSPSRSTRGWRPRCRPRSPTGRRGIADRLEVVHRRRAAGRPRCPARRRPRSSPTCPTTSPCPSCCTCCELLPSLRARSGDGAGRGRRPAGGAARSKVYGVPSVKAAWYADVRRAGAVARNVFWPAPNVDSGLVALDPPRPADRRRRGREVFAVVDAAFAQRRKTLRAALAGWAGSPAGPRRRCAPPASTRGCAASSCGVASFAAIGGGPRWIGRSPWRRPGPSLHRSPSARRPRSTSQLLVGAAARRRLPPARPRSTRPSACTTRCTVAAGRHVGASSVTGRGVAARVPAGRATSRLRAARLLGRHHGHRRRAVAVVRSHKGIPVAGGMAGGCADAAAALVACDALWDARPATPSCWRSPPSSAATSRSRCSAAPPWARGRGELARAGAWPAAPPLGVRASATTGFDPRRLRRVRPAARRRAGRRSPLPSPRCSPRCAPATPTRWRSPAATTSRPRRSRCGPPRRRLAAGLGARRTRRDRLRLRADRRLPRRRTRSRARPARAALHDGRAVPRRATGAGPVAGAHVVTAVGAAGRPMAQPRQPRAGLGRARHRAGPARRGHPRRRRAATASASSAATATARPPCCRARRRAEVRLAAGSTHAGGLRPAFLDQHDLARRRGTRSARRCSATRAEHEWAGDAAFREVLEGLLGGLRRVGGLDGSVGPSPAASAAGCSLARCCSPTTTC